MKYSKLLILAAAAPALLALRGAPSQVRFSPSEGSSSAKSFKSVVELTLDNMSMSLNGQPSPMMPEMDMSITNTQTIGVTDEYVAVRDNAPGTLRRTFDKLSSNMSMSMEMEMMGQSQTQDQNVDSASDLEGKTVVFKWSDDKKEYAKAFDPAQDDTKLLDDLFEDMDLRALLPEGDVKEGAEWEIDVKDLATVLAPGGNLSLKPENVEAEDMMGMPSMGSMSDWLSELLEGEASGKFLGLREVDGKELAAISVKVDIKSAKDMTDMVSDVLEKADLPPEAKSMDFDHMDVEFALEGEGELLWDLEAGHARSFELSGPTRVTMDMAFKIEVPGQGELSIEQNMEMSGTTNMSVSFE